MKFVVKSKLDRLKYTVLMKIIPLLLFLIPAYSFCQTITVKQFDLTINTNYEGVELAQIDSLINSDSISISLASLKPVCKGGGPCYEESIIIRRKRSAEMRDSSTWGQSYFSGVRMNLIDSTVPLNIEDYPRILRVVLGGDVELEPNQSITYCYNPRHAILISNSKDKIIAVYEICFECGNSQIGLIKSELIYGRTGVGAQLFKTYDLMKP